MASTYIELSSIGTPGTDDGALINAAIAALPARGGVIWLDNDDYDYIIGTAVDMTTKPVKLIGQGRSLDLSSAPTRFVKKAEMNGPAFILGHNSRLCGFNIRGESGNGGDIIQVLGAYSALEEITVSHAGRDNIRWGDNQSGHNANYGSLRNVYSSSAAENGGFFDNPGVGGSGNCNAGHAEGTVWRENGKDGLRLKRCIGWDWGATNSSGNYMAGIRCYDGAARHTFDEGNVEKNCDNYTNGTDDIALDAGSSEIFGRMSVDRNKVKMSASVNSRFICAGEAR